MDEKKFEFKCLGCDDVFIEWIQGASHEESHIGHKIKKVEIKES